MSTLSEKARQLATLAGQIADTQEKLDDLHDQFNNATQDYTNTIARTTEVVLQQFPTKDVPPQSLVAATPPTMKG